MSENFQLFFNHEAWNFHQRMLHSIEDFLQIFRIATGKKPEIRLEVIIDDI